MNLSVKTQNSKYFCQCPFCHPLKRKTIKERSQQKPVGVDRVLSPQIRLLQRCVEEYVDPLSEVLFKENNLTLLVHIALEYAALGKIKKALYLIGEVASIKPKVGAAGYAALACVILVEQGNKNAVNQAAQLLLDADNCLKVYNKSENELGGSDFAWIVRLLLLYTFVGFSSKL